MLKASNAKPEAWVRYEKELSAVGAAQKFFARFSAFRPRQAKTGLAGSSYARACGARNELPQPKILCQCAVYLRQSPQFGPIYGYALENFKMKKRISVTLSSDVLPQIDELAGSKRSRSVVMEPAIRNESRQRSSSDNDAADLERINNAADQLNIDAADVLE